MFDFRLGVHPRETQMISCALPLPLRLALVASVLLIASVPQRWRVADAFAPRHGHAARTHGDGNGWGEDEVHALPGWDAPLPSRWFAGFTSAGRDQQNGRLYDMYAHYIFIESEGSPEKDPIIIWTNGGPGAASYFGLFVELGPLTLDSRSLHTGAYNATKVPTLFRNPYAWTKRASILIINGPPPVGYSYCDPAGQSGDGYSCGDWDDERTATHNADFVENFMSNRFGEAVREKEVFVIGESYAGVYVTTLVRELLERQTEINIKGFAIGDACVGTSVNCGANGAGPLYDVEFLRGHGQLSEITYNTIKRTCSEVELLGYGAPLSEPCRATLAAATKEVGPYFSYNVYDTCWYQNDLEPPHALALDGSRDRSYWGPPRPRPRSITESESPKIFNTHSTSYECGGPAALFEWIEHLDVKAALGVEQDAFFFSGDNGVGFNYTLTERSVLDFIDTTVRANAQLKEGGGIRVLVYNGDTDPAINSFVAQNWTSSMGFDVREAWRPYTIDNHSYVGGYATRYAGDFDFVTIRGSGHMVPQYRPAVILSILEKWLDNEDWDYVNLHKGDEGVHAATRVST